MNKSFFIIFIGWCSYAAHAQLPSLDVQVKGGLTVLPDMMDKYRNVYQYTSPVWHGEVNWNVSQYLAVGAFVAQGFGGITEFTGEYGSGNSSYSSRHLTYGGKLRISTGRKARFRPFGEISYGKFEMYIDYDTYRLSTSTNFLGGALGLMIRISSRVYLVIPQFSFRSRSDSFFFEVPGDYALGSSPLVIELTGGLSYNFGKKK